MAGSIKVAGHTIAQHDIVNDVVNVKNATLDSTVTFPAGTIRNVQLVKTVISSAQTPPTGTSVADITGSSISYTPTTGCTSVYYQFTFQVSGNSSSGSILSHGLYIDGSLQDDTKSETTVNYNSGGGSGDVLVTITANISAYSGAKTLSVKCNNYSSNYATILHGGGYWLNSVNTDFYDPILLVYSIM